MSSSAPGPRIALSIPVFIANVFLIVTLGFSALGVIDGLLFQSGIGGTTGLSVFLGLIVLALLILVPHLPKLTLLPSVLAMLWQLAGAPGVAWSMTDPATLLPIDAITLASALVGLLMNRLSYGSFLISADDLPVYERLLVRTLVAVPVAALVLLVTPVVAIMAAVPVMLQQQTGGYLRFGTDGLEVRETILTKGDREVRLVGMVHIGDPQFYRDLYASIPPKALVLAEGVTDRAGVLKASPSYENAARGLGLESQGDFQEMLRNSNRLDLPPGMPQPVVDPAKPFVVFADADVSDLKPGTRKFIEAVGGVFQSSTLDEALQKYMGVMEAFTTAEIMAAMDELLIARNRKALAALDRYEAQFSVIYLPWGAAHMPDFEAQLKARGYVVKSSSLRQIARYGTVLEALAPGRKAPPKPVAVPAAAN
jgi:hypothetical protein